MSGEADSRGVTLPPELVAAFGRSSEARNRFGALPPSHQREYAEWVAGAKRRETRERRAARAVERLLEAPTGE
ncbi:MAG: YdeI/OmpD-associated family protein [Gemmatimonadales bacterium]